MHRIVVAGLAALALAIAGPARATWFEASSAHFVIDADTSEARIRDFAVRLERFDAALHKLYEVPDDPSGRSNRVRIYAVRSGTIARYCGGCPAGTNGFYRNQIGGPAIFTATLTAATDGGDLDLDAQETLLHEYSHHFMYANFPGAYPLWFSEGFAELNANVRFEPDGGVVIGMPANYRAWGLQEGGGMSVRELLAPPRADLRGGARLDMLYGYGWLLLHYTFLSKERRPQVARYLELFAAGTPSIRAGEQAFGDLRALDRALAAYAKGRLSMPLLLPAAGTPAVTVAALSPGAAAMMPVHLRSTAGVDAAQAAALLPDARRRAAPFPGDPRVQVELAEAAFDADSLDEADAAAAAALKADPRNVTAMLYAGRVAMRRLAQAGSHDRAAWEVARRWLVRANRTDTEAAMPLVLYYQSFLAEGATPPALAVDGLRKAQELARQDPGLRVLLAVRMLDDGDAATARALLRPVAYAPHDTGAANPARDALDLIDAGRPAAAKAVLRPPADRPAPGTPPPPPPPPPPAAAP